MKDHATKYYCKTCGTTKFVPERPLHPKRTIHTGCESCGRIVTFKAVGVM